MPSPVPAPSRSPSPGAWTLLRRASEIERADPATLREPDVARTLERIIESGDDGDAMAALRETTPIVYDALTHIDRAGLETAVEERSAFRTGARRVIEEIAHARRDISWADTGHSFLYDRLARSHWPAEGHRFLTRESDGEVRFSMPSPGWRALIGGFAGLHVDDDVRDRLEDLGVERPDVRTTNRGFFFDTSRSMISVPAEDAALLLDAASALATRAQTLAGRAGIPDGFALIRRTRLPLEERPVNALVLPESAALEMRGVAEAVAHGDTSVAEACVSRLRARGVREPRVTSRDVDGVRCVLVTTEQARMLLSPAAEGDPAGDLRVGPTDFEPEAPNYSAKNALFLAEASALAYQEPEAVGRLVRSWFGVPIDADCVRCFDSPETDAQSFVAYDSRSNTLVVAFRGSSSWRDQLKNVRAWLSDGGPFGGGKVHSGFARQLESLLPDLEVAIDEFRRRAQERGKPEPKVMITGHSLGGALAALFAGHLARSSASGEAWSGGLRPSHVYTYGQPRIGDAVFCSALNDAAARIGACLFRFVNGRDFIPGIPPYCQHFDFEVQIDHDGRVVPPGRVRDDHKDSPVDSLTDPLSDHGISHYVQLLRKELPVSFVVERTRRA